ncbi:5-oxoprolinase subunit B family protein [Pseudonocardia acaciae]|uniref:5-oxoprolinase subunit B family protein n=1 Tax=Pseudonocardia acaciae TaxID=551276 RepID=UPI00048C0A42|nr:allophanate hydrolase subunit 1 [Pseudonocardia acaciae]
MDVLRCGIEAALVEVDDRDQVLALHASLRAAPPEGTLELVPAARTLLVRFDRRRTSFARVRDTLAALPMAAVDDRAPTEVVIPVRYDGADLTEVASATGLTRAEVIRRHTAARYTVAFCGFAPGFAYITGLDPALHLPRRATPRTAVPPGSVALADEYTGIYPRSSPGGWRLIGTSELTVWDLERYPPTTLVPGSAVRFEVADP